MPNLNNIDPKWFFLMGMCAGGLSLHLLRSIIIKRQTLKKILLDMQPVKKLANYTGKDYLIVAHGPAFPKKIILEMAKNKRIVALDGAADYLATLGILPDYILGDFDSIKNTGYWGIDKTFDQIENDSKPYLGHHGIEIIPAKNQNLTDLQKAIRFCDSREAESIHVVCATGGREDHSMLNTRTLRAEHKENRPIYLHTKTQTLQFLKNSESKITGKIKDYCGILAFPGGVFSSTGLEYNGENYPLEFGLCESVCNRLREPQAQIKVTGEALLIMPGFFPSQREHEQQQRSERLSLIFKESKRVTALFTIGQLAKAFPTEFKVHVQPQLSSSLSRSEKILVSLKDEDALKLVLTKIKSPRV